MGLFPTFGGNFVNFNPQSLLRSGRPLLLATAVFLSAVLPASATVSTVFTCASSGHSGNHDAIFNGFYVQNLNAANLHTVQIYYTTDQDGIYTLTLTARRGSFAGPQIGSTLTKTVSLSSSADTAVTWDFGDAPFTAGNDVYFNHTESGPGGVQFNLQPQQTSCPGDEETVGTSADLNHFSVAVIITQNTTTTSNGCVANAQTLCIDNQPGDKRFQIRVSYSTALGGGLSGNGQAIPLSSLGVNEGGLFWFFAANNPELLVKVINACTFNNRFWVFFSAGTNVGFHLTVTDTKTGHVLNYTNPDGVAAPPLQDTSTLTCP
jgi:hypothetical protein